MATRTVTDTRFITTCDVCQNEVTYVRQCSACGRDFCLTCEGVFPGAYFTPCVCQGCPNTAAVEKICAKYAEKIEPLMDARMLEIAALKSQYAAAQDEKEYQRDLREKQVIQEMEARIAAACQAAGHKDVLVDYSAYESDADHVPINNLDEVAVPGACVLVKERSGVAGSKDYCSERLTNPTWLQVAVCANKMLQAAKYRDHIFLEGVALAAPSTSASSAAGAPVYRFSMGS